MEHNVPFIVSLNSIHKLITAILIYEQREASLQTFSFLMSAQIMRDLFFCFAYPPDSIGVNKYVNSLYVNTRVFLDGPISSTAVSSSFFTFTECLPRKPFFNLKCSSRYFL